MYVTFFPLQPIKGYAVVNKYQKHFAGNSKCDIIYRHCILAQYILAQCRRQRTRNDKGLHDLIGRRCGIAGEFFNDRGNNSKYPRQFNVAKSHC